MSHRVVGFGFAAARFPIRRAVADLQQSKWHKKTVMMTEVGVVERGHLDNGIQQIDLSMTLNHGRGQEERNQIEAGENERRDTCTYAESGCNVSETRGRGSPLPLQRPEKRRCCRALWMQTGRSKTILCRVIASHRNGQRNWQRNACRTEATRLFFAE